MTTQFDHLADLYERSMEVLPFRRSVEEPSVFVALGDVSGLRVLDLGCGSGLYTRLLARSEALTVTGLDESQGMIDYARRREAQEPLGVRYLVHNARSTDTADSLGGPYDLVLAVNVLPYAPTEQDLLQMCQTVRNALADGGRFVTATLNPDFNTSAGYYEPYGFDLSTPNGAEPQDGDPIGLHARIGDESIDVTPYYWSRAAHERALTAAGFTGITWHKPQVATGVDPATFATYLETPHTVVFTATT
jgi:toxoflavin synthase